MIWVYLAVVMLIVAVYPPAAIPLFVLSVLLAPSVLRWLRTTR